MKIPVPDVPDELTLKQIAELWAAKSEPTEVEILDRFRSAFWLGAFEDDLEDSYLSRVPQKTGHRGPPLPAEPWNRRRALGTLPPIQGVPLPSKPELLSPVARTFQVIIDPALWGILASLERGRFDKYFHALLESFTLSRKDFCQVADRQDWGRPQFWVAPPAPPTRAGAELRCREWLERLMREGPPIKLKACYQDEGTAKFGVGTKAFNRAWSTAISNTGKTDWKKPGPKPKQ